MVSQRVFLSLSSHGEIVRIHNISPLFPYHAAVDSDEVIVLSGTNVTTATLVVFNEQNRTATFIKDGTVLHDFQGADDTRSMKFSLSFDGTQLAVVVRSLTPRMYEVYLNGKLTYKVPFGTEVEAYLDHLEWISNDMFLWSFTEYDRNNPNHEKRHEVYLNGECVTDKIDCERPFPSADGYVDVVVGDFESRMWWKVNRLGESFDQQTLPEEAHYPMRLADLWRQEEPQRDEATLIQTRKGWAVKLDEQTGPAFDGIGCHEAKGPLIVVSRDGQHVGYVGRHISRLGEVIFSTCGKMFDFYEKYEDDKIRGPLAKLVGWMAAMADSPYTGPVHSWYKKNHTYHPATIKGGAWKKGYSAVWDLFFTPNGELVVKVKNRRDEACVVIDQAEGPKFDEVYNTLYLPKSDTLFYIGRKGNMYYRVIVTNWVK